MTDPPSERYRFERQISAKGSFGELWLATDTLLDRPVAVKCPKATHDPDCRERFLAEARMLARLNHPHITQIHDAFLDEGAGRFYLVMEYVDGRDLAEIIGGGTPLPLDWILDVARGVLRALRYVHDQGIVHRDVKPANVLIADDVKLTDFGLANLRAILQEDPGLPAGTVAYMAPEQIERRPLDGRADLYALGVMLFEMIAGGRRPFDCAEVVEMLNAHLHTPPPPLSEFAPLVSPALEQVVMRLLAKDPEERYPSAEAVLDVLGTIPVGPRLSNLPVQLTSFIGREAVLAAIADRLQDPACRLLTLVGPGGSGKTRLALEAATAQLASYEHGVYLVDLAPLQSTASIVPTMARALGFSFYDAARGGAVVEPQQQLLDYLRQKRLLLIMDNYEHLLDGVGLVTGILKAAPAVKVLATSRARLNVQGEHLFPVAGMAVPDPLPAPAAETPEDAARYSALKLFLASARRAQPRFELTADNLADVTRICRLVQGLPLGILLAAAWVELLAPAEIAAEIGQGLDFLETDLRDVPARQRSMRAVFDHSWRLLTEREREVLQRVSVFRGGFTREAAQDVTSATLRELMALVSKSLLNRTSAGRYEVHELLRQYAEERLDQSPDDSAAAHDRHCAYYAAALQQWGEDLKGHRQQTAMAEIDRDIEDAHAAWGWAVEQGLGERLDQAVEGLCLFYRWRQRVQEGEAACRLAAEKLAALPRSSTALGDALRAQAKILVWQGLFTKMRNAELARQLVEQGLALLKRPELAGQDIRLETAFALSGMGDSIFFSDPKKSQRSYEASLTLYEDLGDRWGMAHALEGLGWLARHSGDQGEAKRLFEENLAIRKALGDQRGVAISLSTLGFIALDQGQFEESERLVLESTSICQELGDQVSIAASSYDLGLLLYWLGKFTAAHSSLEKSRVISRELGSDLTLVMSIVIQGTVKMHLGKYEQARAQGNSALIRAREAGFRHGIGVSCWLLGGIALAEEMYVEAQELLQKSLAMRQKIGNPEGLSWTIIALGYALRGLGQPAQARQCLYEALRITSETRFIMLPLFLFTLSVIALILADQGELERAVELYALASRYPYVANSRWFEDVAGRHIAAVAATLPPEVVAAAQERGRARDLDATVAELLVELGE